MAVLVDKMGHPVEPDNPLVEEILLDKSGLISTACNSTETTMRDNRRRRFQLVVLTSQASTSTPTSSAQR